MAKALKCDRCGNFFDLLNEARKYQISDLSGTYPKCVDLCPDCYVKFINFLNGNWRGMHHQEMVGTGDFEEEKYSDWKDAPWLNQKILEESKRIKGEESDGNSSS